MTSVVWKPAPAKVLARCNFRYDNPVPKPECVCGIDWDDACPCCVECECDAASWSPIIQCDRPTRVRVQLADQTDFKWSGMTPGYFDCCSPEAHGIPVLWWAPLVGPPWRPSFTHLMKYVYKDHFIEALSNESHPLFRLMQPALGSPP